MKCLSSYLYFQHEKSSAEGDRVRSLVVTCMGLTRSTMRKGRVLTKHRIVLQELNENFVALECEANAVLHAQGEVFNSDSVQIAFILPSWSHNAHIRSGHSAKSQGQAQTRLPPGGNPVRGTRKRREGEGAHDICANVVAEHADLQAHADLMVAILDDIVETACLACGRNSSSDALTHGIHTMWNELRSAEDWGTTATKELGKASHHRPSKAYIMQGGCSILTNEFEGTAAEVNDLGTAQAKTLCSAQSRCRYYKHRP